MESAITWPIYPGCLYSYIVKCRRRYIFIVKLIKSRPTEQIYIYFSITVLDLGCCSHSTLFFNILVIARLNAEKVTAKGRDESHLEGGRFWYAYHIFIAKLCLLII